MFKISDSLLLNYHSKTFNYNELLEDSYAYCQNIIDDKSKSFSFASRFLDSETKKSVVSLYAFCRMVDDLVDEPNAAITDINLALDELMDTVHDLYYNDVSADPILLTFGHTIRKHKIPIEYVSELIEGVRMDLTKSRYRTFDEFYLYCYRVASTVGLMMTHVFLDDPSEETLNKATDLGIAMQITNILRDINEDYEMGRIYLPEEITRLFDVDEDSIANKENSEDFKRMMKFFIHLASEYYDSGYEGVKDLPKGADFVIELSGRIYSGILKEIESNNFDIFGGRLFVSKLKKGLIAGKLALKYRNSLRRVKQLNTVRI